MDESHPNCRLQELFAPVAALQLPPDPRISWNSYGVMTYFWPSPCDRIQGLWVNVSEYEIMLSTALSHTHVHEHDWDVERDPAGDVLDRIVSQGIIQSLRILNGETVFIKEYDPQGDEETSSSGMSPRSNWDDLSQRATWTRGRGEGWTARAWDWFGMVTE